MRRLLIGLVCCAVLLGACGDDDADARSAITSIPDRTTTAPTTTEPPTPAIDEIPEDPALITEAYVEQVLNALYEVSLEGLLIVRSEGVVEERAIALVEATHSEATGIQAVNDLIATSYSIDSLQESPGPLRIDVVQLIEATSDCVVVEVTTDASQLVNEPPQPEPNQRDFVRLIAATPKQRSSGRNPTAWAIDQFPVTLDGSVPALDCREN